MKCSKATIKYLVALFILLVSTVLAYIFPFDALAIGMHNDSNTNMIRYKDIYHINNDKALSFEFVSQEKNGFNSIGMYFQCKIDEEFVIDSYIPDDAIIKCYLCDASGNVISEKALPMREVVFPMNWGEKPCTVLNIDGSSVEEGDVVKILIIAENFPDNYCLAVLGMKNEPDEETGELDEAFIDEPVTVNSDNIMNDMVPFYKLYVPTTQRPMLLIFILCDVLVCISLVLHLNGEAYEDKD